MSVSMAILAGTTYDPSNKAAGYVAVLFLFIFNSFFAVGWLGMTWLYPAEITPLSIRAPANAVATSGNWIWNFMVVMITPVAFSTIGYQTYIIFAVINAAIVPCVWFFYVSNPPRSSSLHLLTLCSPKQPTGLWKKWTRSSTRQPISSTSSRWPATCPAATARTVNYSSTTRIQTPTWPSRSKDARVLVAPTRQSRILHERRTCIDQVVFLVMPWVMRKKDREAGLRREDEDFVIFETS